MPLTQVCGSQVSSICSIDANEPPTQTSNVDGCPADEYRGPAELPRSPARLLRKRTTTCQSNFIHSVASEAPDHKPKHEPKPEPKPKRRKAQGARAPFDGPVLRTCNKRKNPSSLL